jgi:hypothetical protein
MATPSALPDDALAQLLEAASTPGTVGSLARDALSAVEIAIQALEVERKGDEARLGRIAANTAVQLEGLYRAVRDEIPTEAVGRYLQSTLGTDDPAILRMASLTGKEITALGGPKEAAYTVAGRIAGRIAKKSLGVAALDQHGAPRTMSVNPVRELVQKVPHAAVDAAVGAARLVAENWPRPKRRPPSRA